MAAIEVVVVAKDKRTLTRAGHQTRGELEGWATVGFNVDFDKDIPFGLPTTLPATTTLRSVTKLTVAFYVSYLKTSLGKNDDKDTYTLRRRQTENVSGQRKSCCGDS